MEAASRHTFIRLTVYTLFTYGPANETEDTIQCTTIQSHHDRIVAMMETAGLSPEDAASARAAEQARLRKERREAKIKAGGSARLNKITGLGGGLQRGMFMYRSSANQYLSIH